MGDRECPNCGRTSLVEQGLYEWICLSCGKRYSEEDLDGEED